MKLNLFQMSVHNPALGKTAKERGKSVGEIVNETTIMKEQVRLSTFFFVSRIVALTLGLALNVHISFFFFLSFQLRHPNVVKYHKAFQESKTP